MFANFVSRFYGPKVVLILAFWIVATAVFFWVELSTAVSLLQIPGFIALLVFLLLLSAGYLIWLGYLLVRAFLLLKQHPMRLKFFIIFTGFVIVLTLCGMLFGSLSPLRTTGTEVLAFFGLFNFYVWVLCVCYLPSVSFRGLEMIEIGGATSDEEEVHFSAPEMDFSSNDFEISLSDVDIVVQKGMFSPTQEE